MDFQSAMETFAEAWVAANAGQQTQALALTRSKSPPVVLKKEHSLSPISSPVQQTSITNRHDSLSEKISNNQEDSISPRRYSNSAGVNCPSGTGNTNTNIPSHNSSPLRGGGESIPNSISNRNTPTQRDQQHQNLHLQFTHQQQQHQQQQHQQLHQQQQQQQQQPHQQQHPQHTTQQNLVPNISISNPKRGTPLAILENGLGSCQIQGNIGVDKILSSPIIDRKEFDFAKVNAKSLPLHCIVESVPTLQASLTIDTRNLWKRRPNIETDSYVIVASSTPWSEIVSTALQRLGYSVDIASTARGSLIIKNWKPIPLENISDNPVVPVSDILGELTSVVTLRIVILRTKPTTFGEIKDKLLKLLVLQSHAVLRSTGCPLDEVMLSQICRSSYQNAFPYNGEIADDVKRKFDQWWSNQLSPQSPMPQAAPKILPFINPGPTPTNDMDFPTPGHVAAAAAAAAAVASNHSGLHGGSRESLLAAASESHHHHPHHPSMMVHPALHSMHSQYPASQKTRMRTSFDPEMELPKLQRWFQENPHPSRQQIQSYVIQLNSLESRRGRKPLDVNNVVYWFKNARAAQKRAEVRGQGILGNGYLHSVPGMSNSLQSGSSLLSHPDYMKSPPSTDDIDQISQHSDDDLDDDNSVSRPNSPPQLPLSLTMHERNRSSSDSISIKEESIQMNGDFTERNNNDLVTNGRLSINQVESQIPNVTNSDRFAKENNNGSSDISNKRCSDDRNEDNSEKPLVQSPVKDQQIQSLTPTKSDDDLDMDDVDDDDIDDEYRSPSPRRDISFPMVPNSMFSHSIMYMSHYGMAAAAASGGIHHPHHGLAPVGLGPHSASALANLSGIGPSSNANTTGGSLNLSTLSNDERRKRNRTFIDPVTEVPKLEQWFALNTHPSHNQILKYTEDLNRMPYRQKFPRLESKNVQFWFKNRRAKCKRLKMSLYDPPQQCPQLSGLPGFVHKYEDRD